jgi:hypothetical protein
VAQAKHLRRRHRNWSMSDDCAAELPRCHFRYMNEVAPGRSVVKSDSSTENIKWINLSSPPKKCFLEPWTW